MLICINHPSYDPATPPHIGCRVCCHIFITEIKHRRDRGEAMPRFLGRKLRTDQLKSSLAAFDRIKKRLR